MHSAVGEGPEKRKQTHSLMTFKSDLFLLFSLLDDIFQINWHVSNMLTACIAHNWSAFRFYDADRMEYRASKKVCRFATNGSLAEAGGRRS